MYTKEDLRRAYNAGASNQEMQDAGLEGMRSFDNWYLWAYFDDKVDEWHESDSKEPLHEYLGLTRDQYELWVRINRAPK